MNSDAQPTAPPPEPGRPPTPVVHKMRWPFPLVWVVPLLAAGLAGYFLYQHHQETGTQISIVFNETSGLRPGETTVALRGVTIGHVKDVQLSEDHQHVVAHIRLQQSAGFLTKTNTQFWLVRPEVSLQNISGLNTIVSGPYIDCRPGDGNDASTFTALPGPPAIVGAGVRLILVAEQISQLQVDSPVNYRGIQVGTVKDIRLSSTADAVNVTVFIWERYKLLARTNSQFWMIKGADLQGSLLGGVSLKLGSVQNLLSGGVAFATPEKHYGEFVVDGSKFVLHDQVDDTWLHWKAQIQLPPDATEPKNQNAISDQEKNQLPGLKHE